MLFTSDQWNNFAHQCTDSRPRFAEAMDSDPDLRFERFLSCSDCKTAFAERVPNESALSNFYQNYHGNSVYFGKLQRKLALEKRRMACARFLTKGRRFLDVGCNIGCAVEAARLRGFSALGLELDASAVEIAKQTFPNNRYIVGSLDDLPAPETFDVVLCSEVIEHVSAPAAFIKKLGSFVSPGGILILTTPDAGHVRVRRNLMHWDNMKPPEHLNLFTKRGMRALLKPSFSGVFILPNLKPGIQLVAFKV
jgi:2-polyprenyl-3-methyl-5-hydroxy-6-metoxy-1,4-benzoquinol methylase